METKHAIYPSLVCLATPATKIHIRILYFSPTIKDNSTTL